MIITCWGSRGSIPVSGAEYLIYGGDTTCIELRTRNDEVIIIDAGSGIRRLGHRLLEQNGECYHLLFTHTHLDHVLGLPFFKPMYRSGITLNIYGCPFEYESIEMMLSKILSPPTSPVDFGFVEADIVYKEISDDVFTIDTVEISPVYTSHPNRGLGYKIIEDGRSFVFITDHELSYTHPGGLDYGEYVAFAAGADVLFHDAEFTAEEYGHTKTWGHSVFNDALQFAIDAEVKQFGLFHHNQERSDAEIDAMVNECRQICGDKNVNVEVFAVHAGLKIELNSD